MTSRFQISAGMALLAVLAWAGTSCAQESPAPNPPVQPAPSQSGPVNAVTAPCVQPVPMVRLQDYTGPFQKTIGFFSGPVVRKTVHPAHYKPGTVLCTLTLKDKFHLFVRDAYDPGTFVSAAFNAIISQAEEGDRPFGEGMAGYSKRFAAS